MNASKTVGIALLAGAVGMMLGGFVRVGNLAARANSVAFAAADVDDQPALPKDVYADSRNRLPMPKREDLDDAGKKVYDELLGPKRLVGTHPSVRLYSPKLAAGLEEVSNYLKYETGMPDPLVEIAVLTTAREMDAQYEWTQWETHGRDPKDPRHIDSRIIDIIKYEKPVTGLGEKETAIITFGREMIGKKKVSSETFAEVLRLFGRRGTVDLVWLMANYSGASMEMAAFDQQLLPGQKPLLPTGKVGGYASFGPFSGPR
jgi:4-carboxymuconolactone decarboxylase